jgi:ATP-dependent Lon protease
MPITRPSKIDRKSLSSKEQLRGAEAQMNKTHGGTVLDETKQRLLEFFALTLYREAKGLGGTGTTLCLVAPPGVGKTSLFYSAVLGMQRALYQIPLGSIIAPWELGGSSEGWSNSQPGLIARTADRAKEDAERDLETNSAARPDAGSRATVLLDELDKLPAGNNWGSPYAPLLDALDPEKNDRFIDLHDGEHNPRDLSGFTWLATANTTATIAEPLMSRLQIVQIPGYGYEDRLAIARDYFLPKKIAWAGFDSESLVVEPGVFELLADACTEEGLRWMEHQFERIVSVACARAVMRGASNQRITTADLEPMGISVNPPDERRWRSDYGVALAMAQTQGGDWTPVELQVRSTGGGGEIVVTPPEVVPSVTAAIRLGLGVINSRVDQLGLPAEARSASYHFHFETGSASVKAVSVGPSATSAVAIALASLWTKKATQDAVSIAQLDLTGRLMRVGADDVVASAAARHRVPLVFLASEANVGASKVLETVDANVRYVGTFDDLLRQAIPSWDEDEPQRTGRPGYL